MTKLPISIVKFKLYRYVEEILTFFFKSLYARIRAICGGIFSSPHKIYYCTIKQLLNYIVFYT